MSSPPQPGAAEASASASASASRSPAAEQSAAQAEEIEPVVEVAPYDPADDDVDSALGDDWDRESSTASLSASVLEYRTLHGRTYHSEKHGGDKWWGPNDDRQNEAMDMNHHFLTLCLDGKLFLSPLKDDIQKVLDIGTGTGIWAIDMGDQYPDCEVIGTDLSPIQPSWFPPNVRFEIDDCEQEWTFAPGSFDFVHCRYILGGVSDWPRLFRQAHAALRPGGWLESFECEADYRSDDGTIRPDSAMMTWSDLFRDGGRKLGRSFTLLSDDTQRKSMEAAGFVDITVKNIKIPIGPWAADPKLRELGQWVQHILEADLEGYIMFMWNTVMERPLDEMHIFLMSYRKEIRDRTIHAYLTQRVVYGRKPEHP